MIMNKISSLEMDHVKIGKGLSVKVHISDIFLDESIYPRDNIDPLLYAAKLAIGPKQLTESETRNTARRAFQADSKLTTSEIGRAVGRSRQAVGSYIADLRAATVLELELKIFCLNQLGIPQDRAAKRLGITQKTLSNHSAKMSGLAKWLNSDLSKGFTVPQTAQKHGWPEPMVWPQALKGKDDQARFKELQWR